MAPRWTYSEANATTCRRHIFDDLLGGKPSVEVPLEGNGKSLCSLRIHRKRPHAYHPIPHLDPAIRVRLQSALQRPDLKPTTRAKIEAILGPDAPIKLQHACRH